MGTDEHVSAANGETYPATTADEHTGAARGESPESAREAGRPRPAGRPKLYAKRVEVNMTEDDAAALDELAKIQGIKRSDVMRELLRRELRERNTRQPHVLSVEDRAVIEKAAASLDGVRRERNRAGNVINQIARAVNTTKELTPKQYVEVMGAITEFNASGDDVRAVAVELAKLRS